MLLRNMIFVVLIWTFSAVQIKSGNLSIHISFDSSAYYELNETKKFTNFKINWLMGLMEEYPALKIRFNQTIVPQETLHTAKKRLNNFGKALEQGGVDVSRIEFDSTVYYLNETDPNQKSRIQGVVISFE